MVPCWIKQSSIRWLFLPSSTTSKCSSTVISSGSSPALHLDSVCNASTRGSSVTMVTSVRDSWSPCSRLWTGEPLLGGPPENRCHRPQRKVNQDSNMRSTKPISLSPSHVGKSWQIISNLLFFLNNFVKIEEYAEVKFTL